MVKASVLCKNGIGKAVKSQGLVLVASKNHGKTNRLMVIASNLKAQIVVCDYATQHAFKLGENFTVRFLSKDYWIKPKIRLNGNTILDFSQTTKKVAGEILRDIIKMEYYRRVQKVIKGFREGKTREEILNRFHWLIFALEEAQDVIGRYLKQDDDLATAMNCGRNYKISFCFLTQRIADLNSSLVERCAFLIGKQTGDNNLRKISSTIGISRKKLKFVEGLKKGEFIFYNGEGIKKVKFPKFAGFGRAYEYKTEIIQRRKSSSTLWEKLKESFKKRKERRRERRKLEEQKKQKLKEQETQRKILDSLKGLEIKEDEEEPDEEEDFEDELEEEEDFILMEEDEL